MVHEAKKQKKEEQEVVYTNTALSTVLTADGRHFFVEIPYNFETGQVGQILKKPMTNRDASIEAYKLESIHKGNIS